jgi:hypothetical protein
MAMVDGHFNPERINQAEARGIRAGGQAQRSEAQRKVIIRRYVSVLPKDVSSKVQVLSNIWDNISPGRIKQRLDVGANAFYNPFRKEPSSDEWVYATAKGKEDLNKVVHQLIKQSSSPVSCITHEQFEEFFLEKYADVVSGAVKAFEFGTKHPLALGTALGATIGLALGGTAPRSAQEAKRDPNAPLRNRLSALAGGAAGGAAGGYLIQRALKGTHGSTEAALALLSNPAQAYMPVLDMIYGPIAGRNVADLFAPMRTIPKSVQEVLGKGQKAYSDKALFEKYWETFGKQLEDKGPESKVDKPELEAKFVNALKDLYQEASVKKPSMHEQLARMDAKGRQGPKPSKKRFLLEQGLLGAVGGPALVGAAQGAVQEATNRGMKGVLRKVLAESTPPGELEDLLQSMPKGPSPVTSGLTAALPIAVGAVAGFAKTYKDMG